MDFNKILGTGADFQGSECGFGEAESEADLEKLESDVSQMAQIILHCRANLPDQLKYTFSSILVAQRPVVPRGLEPGTSIDPNRRDGEQVRSSEGATSSKETAKGEDKETAEKIRLLKDKISSNISLMPSVLKRMKDCISTIDKLDSHKGIIHPVFKRRKTS